MFLVQKLFLVIIKDLYPIIPIHKSPTQYSIAEIKIYNLLSQGKNITLLFSMRYWTPQSWFKSSPYKPFADTQIYTLVSL